MTTTKRPVGRPATIADPRQTIMAHAARMFATQGYENTSLSQIASATGISKAALYHYFPAKQEIYDAIVVEMLQNMKDQVWARVEQQSSFKDRLKAFMTAHADFFQDNYQEFVTLLHGISGTSRGRSAEELAARARYENALRSLVQSGTEAGDIRQQDTAVVARAILAPLNAMPRWFNPKGTRRAAEFAEEFFDLLFEGLRQR